MSDWGRYEHMTMDEILYDYGVVRGDLTERYARVQLRDLIAHKIEQAVIGRLRKYDSLYVAADRYVAVAARHPVSLEVAHAMDSLREALFEISELKP